MTNSVGMSIKAMILSAEDTMLKRDMTTLASARDGSTYCGNVPCGGRMNMTIITRAISIFAENGPAQKRTSTIDKD